ncbi:MAG TPA: hypothetical protein VF275_05430 [Gammaproteobacteria bacterium]
MSEELKIPPYLDARIMWPLREALRDVAQDGERVIYRDAFRWMDDADDCVLPNHYEMQSIEYLADEFNYEIVANFCHAAIIKERTS